MKAEDFKQAIAEIKRYRGCNSFSISTKSCNIIIEALEIQIPKHPRHIHSYENSDADGNRGIWMDFIECPNCGYDLSCEDGDIEHCPECNQLLEVE